MTREQAPAARPTVLVIEDDDETRRVLARGLGGQVGVRE